MFETIITCKCVSVLKDEMIFAVKKKKKKSSCKSNRKNTQWFLHANQLITYRFLSLQLYAWSRRPASGTLFLQARKSIEIFTAKANVQIR